MNLKHCYERMWLIRLFDEAVERLFTEGRIAGTAHTCIGQEATAVGVAEALAPGDAITSTHRGHGHFLARGADPRRVMAELFGSSAGYSGGRGGSQMMTDITLGFYGSNGITGGSIPFAAGLALDARLRATGRVVACFFGDGASNQGTFHESLNLAALWQLGVVFVCENNGYAMSTPVARGLANPRVSARAAAYGIPGVAVDGNDVTAVYQAMSSAVAHARAGQGPTLLECQTYRLSGHSRGDPRVYRTRDEERLAHTREPIARLEATLRAAGDWDETVAAGRERAQTDVDAAIHFAMHSALPLPAGAATGVYACAT